MSVRIGDFTDREILFILIDSEPGLKLDGRAGLTTRQMAETLGVEGDNSVSCTGARLAWLRRFGMVERTLDTREWNISDAARTSLMGTVRAVQVTAIENAREGELFALTGLIAKRYMDTGELVATGMRRELTHSQKQRRLRRR